jgi:hypothetical protein
MEGGSCPERSGSRQLVASVSVVNAHLDGRKRYESTLNLGNVLVSLGR